MFRRKTDTDRRPALIEDLERLLRRAKVIPLAAPILLLGGWGLGKVATRTLALPEDTRVQVEEEAPAIQLEALGELMERIRADGERTVDYVSLYSDHVAPVERALRRRGVPTPTARQVAWPLVQHAYRSGLDLPTVVSVVLIESQGKPRATSRVGARGLMQVMPLWAGNFRNCTRDLYDIEGNLCHGTKILSWYLRKNNGDTRRALLGYNGCVRGTNTPDCHRYPDKVERLAAQIRREMQAPRVVPAAAAP